MVGSRRDSFDASQAKGDLWTRSMRKENIIISAPTEIIIDEYSLGE